MKNKILKTLMIIFSALVIGYLLFFVTINMLIEINLNGSYEVNIPYKNTYIDEGVKASLNKKDITSKIVVKDNIDYNKLGRYEIKYTIKYLGINKTVKRIVNIIDNESPKITLKGDNPLTLTYGKEYIDPGYDVIDNYDDKVKVEITGINEIDSKQKGEYIIEYKAIDSNGNYSVTKRKVIVEDRIVVKNGVTYVEGILLVNKKYSIPKTYGNGIDKEANEHLKELQKGAKKAGYTITLVSGYRSYEYQKNLYNNYVNTYGQKEADTFSARPGHSEHQTGLAFDVGKVSNSYGETEAGKWLAKNAHLYGFIIRYPKGKEEITGYQYEPWHIRYLGKNMATKVYESGLCLEEYLQV